MAKKKAGKKGQGQPKPPPICKAILLCDKSIIEAVTAKTSIIGIFDSFNVHQVPCRIPPFEAFVQIAEGVGRYDIVVEVHDLRERNVIARAVCPSVEFADRLVRMNLMIPVPSLSITHAGRYDFVIFANGAEIDRQTFQILARQENHDDDDNAQE